MEKKLLKTRNFKVSFIKNISNEDINKLPVKHFGGSIIVIEDYNTLKDEIHNLKNESILGFDTETKPNFKKGKKNTNSVALLQLSSTTKVFIIRLNKIGLPDEITKILADKKITKVGVAVNDDINALQRLNNFTPKSFIDLADYTKEHEIEANGLRKLAGIVLKLRISKNQQLSNWENEILTLPQLKYAATDAWACIEIYNALLKLEKK